MTASGDRAIQLAGSLSLPIAANIDGVAGPEIIKGGVTLNQVVNLGVAVGQNLPYNHVVQAWNAQTGASLPSFPQAVEDFQLLSSPAVANSDTGHPAARGSTSVNGPGQNRAAARSANPGCHQPGQPFGSDSW